MPLHAKRQSRRKRIQMVRKEMLKMVKALDQHRRNVLHREIRKSRLRNLLPISQLEVSLRMLIWVYPVQFLLPWFPSICNMSQVSLKRTWLLNSFDMISSQFYDGHFQILSKFALFFRLLFAWIYFLRMG